MLELEEEDIKTVIVTIFLQIWNIFKNSYETSREEHYNV